MVAGYHNGGYARAAALLYSRLDLRANGVYHAGKADEYQVMLERLGRKIVGRGVVFSHRRREHAQSLIRHPLVFRGYCCPYLVCHRNDFSVDKGVGAEIDDNIGSTLCVLNNAVRCLVDGGHHLSAGVKRSFADSRAVAFQLALMKSEAYRKVYESRFGGFSRDCSIRILLRVGAEGHGSCEQLFVAVMIDDGHLILRESACLVRADYLRAAERLNSGELADNRIFLRHVRNAYRQHDSDHRRKSLGNGGNGEADGYHKHVDNALEYQRGIAARESGALHEQREREDENADSKHEEGESLRESRKLFLERGLSVLCLCYGVGYLAHLGVHARVGDDRLAASVDDGAAHISHIFSVAERNIAAVARAENGDNLAHGYALARQRSLLYFKAGALEYAAVRGNSVARLEYHDIADGQVFALDSHYPALAYDLGGRRAHLLQRFNGLFRLTLLQNAEHGVYEHNGEDYHGVRREGRRAGDPALVDCRHGGYDRGDDKDDYHRVGKLLKKPPDERFLLCLCQFVFAVFLKTAFGLGLRKSVFRALRPLKHLADVFKIVLQFLCLPFG